MSTNDPDRTNGLVSRIVDVFDQVEIPLRPTIEETMEAISGIARPNVRRTPFHRRRIVRIMVPLAALAASIVLTISLWPSAQSSVFAQVIEQIKKADAVAFTMTFKRPGFSDMSANAYAKSPNLLRYDLKSKGHISINIMNYATHELTSLDPNSNRAIVRKLPADETNVDIVRRLRQMKPDLAKRVVDTDAESDPNINVFEIQEDGAPGKIWVDKQTKLPVRIEMYAPPESGLGGVVYSNFDWNPTIADSMFEIPAGFKITRNNLLAEPTEEELVAALRIRQAFSDEPYRKDFLANQGGLAIGRLAYDRSLSTEENHQRRLQVLGPILREIGVSNAEAQDAKALGERIDYLCMKVDQWADLIGRHGAWIGEGVQPGEEKPLGWWRKPGAENVRVLYGNLTIRDADQPPTPR
jgi:outer membrane lipoprotein-sorting protein